MKSFYLYTPQREKVVIHLDDEDAHIMRSYVWKAYDATGRFRVYKASNGVNVPLGQYLLNSPDRYVVLHKNGDNKDFRKANLLAVSRKDRMAYMRFLSPTHNPLLAPHSHTKYNCGHPKTTENTYLTKGKPVCRECNLAATKRWYRRKKLDHSTEGGVNLFT